MMYSLKDFKKEFEKENGIVLMQCLRYELLSICYKPLFPDASGQKLY